MNLTADLLLLAASVSLGLWLILLILPWRSWLNGEVLENEKIDLENIGTETGHLFDGADLTVLIPARNERHHITDTLSAIEVQDLDVQVILVDDGSSDGTGELVQSAFKKVKLLTAPPKPDGWSGKLWALHHGLKDVKSSQLLLLDADIQLEAEVLVKLLRFKAARKLNLVSVMAQLRNESFWEKLLIPAFVFFFKQIYPFRLSNSSLPLVAAAAGGCILIDTEVLRSTGGFEKIRGEIIDDCSLARQIKDSQYRTWIGLSHQVKSQRKYDTLASIWLMIDRTAFTQLGHSFFLLLLCTSLMLVCFWAPVAGMFHAQPHPVATLALICMMLSYLPTLFFYRQGFYWALLQPIVGTIYLTMTWSSALKYWFGKGAQWKGRQYIS